MVPGPPGNGSASQDGAAYIAREVDVGMVAARKGKDRFGPSRFRRSRRVEEAHPRFRRADLVGKQSTLLGAVRYCSERLRDAIGRFR